MNKNKLLLYAISFVISISFAGQSFAAQETDDADLGGFIAPPEWKEGDVTFPPFPRQDNLLKVELDKVDSPFNFYIDSKSISVSPGGELVRYTMVIESDSGGKNVLYEAIRCRTHEFRTYAYGTSDNKFIKARVSKWEQIKSTSSMRHRYSFYSYYMCNEYQTNGSVDTILQKIKYPENFEVSGERDD